MLVKSPQIYASNFPDYYGRWKMLQYFAMDFFSPIIINGHLEQNNVLNIYIATDHTAIHDSAVMTFYKWGSLKYAFSFTFKVDVVSIWI